MSQLMTRRQLLRFAGLAGSAAALAACQPKVVEKIVERTVVVTEEKLVKETVVVKEAVEVEKEVTRVVEKQVAAAPTTKEPVTVTVQSKTGAMNALQDCFDTFNVSQDWVTVECSATTHDKMMVGWATQTGPDWIRTDPIEMEYPVRVGALSPIQDFVDRDMFSWDWLYDIVKPWVNFPIPGGPAYVVPWTGGSFVVFYNKDHFDEAGIPYPDADWTWNDYGAIAQKLTKKDSNGLPTQLGSFNWPTMWWNSWLIPLMQAGGVPFDHPLWGLAGFTDPQYLSEATKCLPGASKEAMKQGLQMQLDLIYTYEACPRPGYELPEGSGFLAGNMSMNFGSANYASQVIVSEKVARWGVQRPPKAPTEIGRHSTQAYLVGFALGSHSEHKDAAWEAMKFFMSDGARKCNWSQVHEWCWPKDLEDWIMAQSGMDESFVEGLKFNDTTDAVFIPPVPDFNRFFNEAIDPISDLVFNQEMSVDEAVDQMEAEGDAVLKGQ
jgi:multiple sugar transport system substrate-binding protein